MTDHQPAAPVDVFGSDAVDRVDVEMSTKAKRWTRVAAALLAIMLPLVVLLTSATKYELRCEQAAHECILDVRRAFVVEQTTLPFAEIEGIGADEVFMTAEERTSSRTVHRSTGRSILVMGHRGTLLTASFAEPSETLPADALRAHIEHGVGATFAHTSTMPIGDMAGVGAFFLVGLLLFAWTKFRTSVVVDNLAGVVSVEHRYWPLQLQASYRGRAADIVDVHTPGAEQFLHSVVVVDASGEHRVGRYLSRIRSEAIADAIRRFARRP